MAKKLLPATGSMKMSKERAARAFLQLALQDADCICNQGELYLAAVKGEVEALAEIAALAYGGHTPFGAKYGQVNVSSFTHGWGTCLAWDGTKGRYIHFDFSRNGVKVSWDSGTGKPSRFITESLA